MCVLKLAKYFCQFGLICSLFLVILYCLPLPKSLTQQEFSTVLYSEDGKLLAARISVDEQWRFPAVERLPEKYVEALLLFEDKRFYQHPGIDPIAVVRAAVSNTAKGEIVSGASTITMQLARMISGNQSRTLGQKIKEMVLALQLELHYSKEEILIYYASHAPFGGNNIGLAAANWRYFGHTLDKMTWAEAALFAVLPNAPSSISPGRNRAKLLIKRNRLLERLFENNQLSELDLTLAKLEPLPDRPKALPNIAPHLLATLQKQQPKTKRFVSTLNGQLQQQVLNITKSHIHRLGQKNIHNLSVLILDNVDYKVLAYIGNHTYQGNKNYGPSVDIAQRARSSGSLFKPFLFALMLQRGDITGESLVLDIPSYHNGYTPKNYDRSYRGAVTAQEALIQSLNVPAVTLLKQYGVAPFKEDLEHIGLSTLFRPADDYGLTLIIGGAETTLWDITNAYAGLSMSASGHPFRVATLLTDKKNNVEAFPINTGAAWLTLEALKKVKRPGVASAWEQFSSSQHIAWKTGTSYGWHDGWAIGTNSRYTVGVWAGNANNEEGRGLTGTKAAAPVMLDVFRLLPEVSWPEKPEYALNTYKVCKNDAYLLAAGCETKWVDMPKEASLTTTSPFHRRFHVDKDSGQRIHAACESTSNMKVQSHFVLPPVAEYYYKKNHPNYRSVPLWREDCQSNIPILASDAPMQLEYPTEGAIIKIPVELDGNLGRIILRAQHRNSSSILHWHLNSVYLGETQYIHEKAIAVNAGWHQLILMDEKGYRLKRWFKVI